MGSEETCGVCGRWVDEDFNVSGLLDHFDDHMPLCMLHYKVAMQVAKDGVVNWFVMASAQSAMHDEKPDMEKDPDAWAQWDPLDMLVRLYREREDWPDLVALYKEDRAEFMEDE